MGSSTSENARRELDALLARLRAEITALLSNPDIPDDLKNKIKVIPGQAAYSHADVEPSNLRTQERGEAQ